MAYKYLSGRLRQLGITHSELGAILGLSAPSISRRFNGTLAWDINEIYTILDLCKAPPEEFHLYFPRAAAEKGRKAS